MGAIAVGAILLSGGDSGGPGGSGNATLTIPIDPPIR